MLAGKTFVFRVLIMSAFDGSDWKTVTSVDVFEMLGIEQFKCQARAAWEMLHCEVLPCLTYSKA